MSFAVNFFLGTISSHIADLGLANSLCVETLKHGTDLPSYLSIRWVGGVSTYESFHSIHSEDRRAANVNYFYIFKENIHYLTGLVEPQGHKIAASINRIKKLFPSYPLSFFQKSLIGLSITTTILATPIINFRFCKQEITERFENDPAYRFGKPDDASIAYRTKEKVEAWRIGFFGTILAGVNTGWLKRAKEEPWRVIKGAVQLTGAALVAWYAGPSIQTVSFLAGFILA